MHSADREGRLHRLLRSQELGIICGMSAVVLLAVGSVVLVWGRESGHRLLADELQPFFTQPSLTHTWLYLLLAVVLLYAVSAALATVHSLRTKWRAGARQLSLFAPSVFHVALLVALLAHAVGGWFGAELGMVVVGPDFVSLNDTYRARVTELHVDLLPDGDVKEVRAHLELRNATGELKGAVVGYNAPLSFDLGSDLFLLVRQEQLPPMHGRQYGGRIMLRHRSAPGNPLALLAALLLAAGVAMMWRKLIFRGPKAS